MTLDAASRATVLERLSREPEAVVARALALDPGARLVGGSAGEEGVLLVHPARSVVHAVDRLSPGHRARAVAAMRDVGPPPDGGSWTYLGLGRPADPAEGDPGAELLHLSALRSLDRVPPFVGASGPPPRVLRPEDLRRLRPLPADLARTLEEALARPTEVYGVVVEDRVVSFACAFWVGDLWWDMSVDTLPAFRRRGLGTACAVALIRELAPRGLRPVNAPETGSGGAPGFLAYLGFEEAGALVRWSDRGEAAGG